MHAFVLKTARPAHTGHAVQALHTTGTASTAAVICSLSLFQGFALGNVMGNVSEACAAIAAARGSRAARVSAAAPCGASRAASATTAAGAAGVSSGARGSASGASIVSTGEGVSAGGGELALVTAGLRLKFGETGVTMFAVPRYNGVCTILGCLVSVKDKRGRAEPPPPLGARAHDVEQQNAARRCRQATRQFLSTSHGPPLQR